MVGIPIPIASIHLKTQSYEKQNNELGNRGKCLFTKRWNKSPLDCHFQGIISKNSQDIEFVLTNLTGEDVNFKILKQDNQTDPGGDGRLNRVNVISPFTSYVVKTDQKDNRSLVFSAVKNKSLRTVKEEETSNEPPQGTYYWLSVLPVKGGKNETLFKNTRWMCVDYFIIKEFINKEISHRGATYAAFNYGTVDLEDWSSDSDNLEIGYSNKFVHFEDADDILPLVEAATTTTDVLEGDTEYDDYDELPVIRLDCEIVNDVISPPPVKQEVVDLDLDLVLDSIPNPTDRKRKRSQERDDNETKKQKTDIVGMSFVGRITSGREIIQNDSVKTNVEYNSNLSAKCKIGLSMFEGLTIEKVNDESIQLLVESGKRMIQNFKQGIDNDYLTQLSKIYKEDTCVICLDDNPNLIFFQCGHQCMHQKCDNKMTHCPLCRLKIVAKITETRPVNE